MTNILRANNKRWNPETLKVENAVDIKEHVFKPKDWCLMRDADDDEWELCIFARYNNNNYNNKSYITIGGGEWFQCIPYEGNESLLGTDKNP